MNEQSRSQLSLKTMNQWKYTCEYEDMKCSYLLHKHRLKKQSHQLHYAECSWVPTESIHPLLGCSSHMFGGTLYHWIHHKCKSEDRKEEKGIILGWLNYSIAILSFWTGHLLAHLVVECSAAGVASLLVHWCNKSPLVGLRIVTFCSALSLIPIIAPNCVDISI